MVHALVAMLRLASRRSLVSVAGSVIIPILGISL